MNDQDKTKEELILELQKLRQEKISFRTFYENEIAKFRSYFELLLIGVSITSPEKGWIEANKAARDMLGYSMEELSGLSWAELTHPDDMAAEEEQFNRVLSDQQDSYFLEKRFIRKNGEIVWTNITVECVRNPDRSVDYIVALLQDISERKQAEKELKKSENELKRAQELTHIGSFSIDLTTNQVTWSEELYKMYGFDPALPPPLLNESQTLFTPESWELLSTSISNTVKTGVPYEIELTTIKNDGSNGWMWARGEAVMDAEGKITNLWGTVQDITDRKLAVQAIMQSEEKFRSLYDHMSEGSAMHTLVYNDQGVPEDYLIVEVNPAFESELGISREMVINKTSMVAYGVEEPPFFEIYSRVALTGNPEAFETYFPPLDKHFHISVYCPNRGSFATIFKNITESKKTEKDLHIILTKYQVLFEILPIGITISDAAGKIIESNQIAETILGMSREEQENRKIGGQEWRIIRPDGTTMPPSEFASVQALEQGCRVTNVEMGIIKGNNQVTWLNVSAAPMPIEGYGVAIIYGDITNRKLTEQALKESEEKYRNLFEKAQIGMFRTRMDGSKVIDVNEKLLQTFGYSYEEMISNPSTIRYANPERRNELIRQIQQKGLVVNFEVEMVRKDNSLLTALLSVLSYPEEGILEGSFVDITERKKAENTLKTSEAKLRELNATKDKFFSIVAHDLKSPFGAILGFSQLLKNEARDLDIDSIVNYTNIIHSSVQRTFSLLENLLDWAKAQQGGLQFEPRKYLINNLIVSEIDSLKHNAAQKNISLVNGTTEEIIITADEKMLSTVIRNLISNAIKFTPKEGSVIIEAKRNNDQVEVTVSDTGIGMKKETIDKLFKIETSFSTRGTENEKGSGLGLLLCKEFVAKHGGSICAESEPGKGSTFKFTIPLGK